ncbi:MAG: MATE family efflux transporter [Treponema sp.]|jgi:putative MATE family efflux protein|nr:MATE family efflux transporter [Treponema sp.]
MNQTNSTPQPMSEQWTSRALFRLLWPLIIEQILAVTMGAADTVMMSGVGQYAISAINIVDNLNNLLIIVFAALCTGGAVVVSQYIGRRDQANSQLASRQLVYVAVAAALGIMLVALLFRKPILWLFYGALSDDVRDAAELYLLITALSYPALALYNANAALFRAAGNSKVTMRIALLVNVMNIGGNAFCIYALHIGVLGAALSTLVGRSAAAAITTVMLVRDKHSPISLAGLFTVKFIRPMLRSILNVGVPSGLESSMFQLGRLLTQRVFPTFGTGAIAANAIASVINSFSFMPGMACGIALLTIVGQCVGAGDYGEAKKQCAKLIKLAYLIMFVVSGSVFLFMEPLVSLFKLSPDAHELAKSFLRVHCVSMVIGWPLSFALPNALRAAGDARFCMMVASISMWTVRVSLAYLLVYVAGVGPIGVWLAMGCDFLVRGSCYTWRWVRGHWQTKRVL